MTFFIASNVVAYHQTEMPSDADTDKLFQSCGSDTSSTPTALTVLNQNAVTNGVVQETRPNQLETVTCKWTTHFFQGIGETNLVLQILKLHCCLESF